MIDPEVLLQGYRLGVFPMAMADGAIEWFSPDDAALFRWKRFIFHMGPGVSGREKHLKFELTTHSRK